MKPDESLLTHVPREMDGAPLPILLRVPWFPPEPVPPPVLIDAEYRRLPVVVRPVPLAVRPPRLPPWFRRLRWEFVVYAVLAIGLGAGVGWRMWGTGPGTDCGTDEASANGVNASRPGAPLGAISLTGERGTSQANPSRLAWLSPEIVPLDDGSP